MDKKVNNLRQAVKYKSNPLVVPKDVHIKGKVVRIKEETHMVDVVTGEYQTSSAIVERKQVDKTEFVKLYSEGIKQGYSLSPSANKAFQLVLKATQNAAYGSDRIYIHFMDAVEDPDFPISQQTFHRGMKELLNKDFIAASERPNWYWINPHLFFKGDRVAFIKEYIINKEKKIIGENDEPGDSQKQQSLLDALEG